jgi:glycosyltransferase involved in cell wall biosynthesis
MDVSLVIPLLDEEDNVALLHQEIAAAMSTLQLEWEAIYVDDGSKDRTAERLAALVEHDPHSRLVILRRNFGQTAAIQAGIDQSTGSTLVFLDGDLQNDPNDIPMLLAKLDEGYDVVSGWRVNRHDAFLTRKVPSHFANWIISRITGVHLRDYGCTLKAYRRAVLIENKLYGDMHRFIPALASWSGAKIAEVPVTHHARQHGKSKYGLSRTFRVLLDLGTVKFLGSYRTQPSYLFGGLGLILWILGLCSALVVLAGHFLVRHFAYSVHFTLAAGFFVTIGTLFLMLGLFAELSVRTYYESQDKRTYVIRSVVDQPTLSEPSYSTRENKSTLDGRMLVLDGGRNEDAPEAALVSHPLTGLPQAATDQPR